MPSNVVNPSFPRLVRDEVAVVVIPGDQEPVVVVLERPVQRLQAERLPRPPVEVVVARVQQERHVPLVGDGR